MHRTKAMNKTIAFLLSLTTLLCQDFDSYASPRKSRDANHDFSYHELSPGRGYPSHINSIYIEDYGYSWVSSNTGLYRINYNRIEHINSNSVGLFKTPGDEMYDFFVDGKGIAWSMTDKGLSGRFLYCEKSKCREIEIPEPRPVVYCKLVTKDAIYFGGTNRIWKYDYEKERLSDVISFNSYEPFRIKRLAMGLLGRILIFGKSGHDVYLFSPDKDKIEQADPSVHPWVENYSNCFVDKDYTVWVSIFNDGIYRYNHRGEELAHYSVDSGLSSNNILCFMELDGKLWLGTDGGGINIIDFATGDISILKQDPDDPLSLPSNTITCLASNGNGTVWAGRMHGGLIIIKKDIIKSFKTTNIRPKINNDGLLSLYKESGNGDILWVGTNGSGLLSYSISEDKFTAYPVTAGLKVCSMASLNEDEIIFTGTTGETYIFNKKTQTLRKTEKIFNKTTEFSITNNGFPSVTNDAEGRIIGACEYLYTYNYKTKEYSSMPLPYDCDPGELQPVCGSKGAYFNDYENVYKWDEEYSDRLVLLKSFKEFGQINSVAYSNTGVLWLAMSSGIVIYNLDSGKASLIDGLFHESPKSILCDKFGKIWIGTSGCLYAYYPTNGNLLMLDELDGAFENDYNIAARFVDTDGNVYMGGVNGFIKSDGDLSFPYNKEPEIEIGSVLLNGIPEDDNRKFVVPSSRTSINMNFNVRDNYILRNKTLRFELAGDKRVYKEESRKPQLVFQSLASGAYKVYGQIRTSDGSWTKKKLLCEFKVNGPWFMSWWMAMLIFFLLLVVSGTIYMSVRRKSRIEAERIANEERFNFLVNVSHELRTPLMLVMGPLNRIIHELQDGNPQKEKLRRIYTQADRMKTLLNTILTTNKIKAGAAKLKKETADLNSWIENNAQTFNDEAKGRGMDIIINTDPSVGMVEFDDNMLQIVFANFMVNAMKHNETGKPLCVETTNYPDRSRVRVSVSDRGTGIGNIPMEYLFKRFYQTDNEKAGTGFGIGLAYSKAIVEAHNGDIGAFNNKNDKGATFWFELPKISNIAEIEKAGSHRKRLSKKGESGSKLDLKSKTLLFVDDDPDLRRYIYEEYIDKCQGLKLAVNGKDAMKFIDSEKFDIVISDIMMPEMNGYELCSYIKNNPGTSSIPVILLTARADTKSRKLGLTKKADFYMSKPFTTEDLTNVIYRLLAGRE